MASFQNALRRAGAGVPRAAGLPSAPAAGEKLDATALMRSAGVRVTGAGLGQPGVAAAAAALKAGSRLQAASAADLRPVIDREAVKRSIAAATQEQAREKMIWERQDEAQRKGQWGAMTSTTTAPTAAPGAAPGASASSATSSPSAAATSGASSAAPVAGGTAAGAVRRALPVPGAGRSLLAPPPAAGGEEAPAPAPQAEAPPVPAAEAAEEPQERKGFLSRMWAATEERVRAARSRVTGGGGTSLGGSSSGTPIRFNASANQAELDRSRQVVELIKSERPFTLQLKKEELVAEKARTGSESKGFWSSFSFNQKSETEVTAQQATDMELKVLNLLSEEELTDNERLKELLDDDERLQELAAQSSFEVDQVRAYLTQHVQFASYQSWVTNYRARFPKARIPNDLINLGRLVNARKGFLPQDAPTEEEYRKLGTPDNLRPREWSDFKRLRKAGKVRTIQGYMAIKEKKQPRTVGTSRVARSYERMYA